MIKVTCNEGQLQMQVEGNGITIMSELCVIIDSVCDSFTEDEEEPKTYKNFMIMEIARALMRKVRDSEKADK